MILKSTGIKIVHRANIISYPSLLRISRVIIPNLKSHSPLRCLPPSHKLELSNSLFREDLQPIHNNPSTLRRLAHFPDLPK